MPNLLKYPQQPFLVGSPFFYLCFSMDTKSLISPSSDGKSYVYVIVDAFTHFIVFHPSPKNDAANALIVLIGHRIVKFGKPEISVTDNGNENINGEFTHFRRINDIQFKPRTPYAPWSNGLLETSNRQLNTFLRTVLNSQYDTWSQEVAFPYAFYSHICIFHNTNSFLT